MPMNHGSEDSIRDPEQPRKSGRAHWLLAESLVAQGNIREATVHALLALAAPAYAFHQERP